jgi:hypothetical protein
VGFSVVLATSRNLTAAEVAHRAVLLMGGDCIGEHRHTAVTLSGGGGVSVATAAPRRPVVPGAARADECDCQRRFIQMTCANRLDVPNVQPIHSLDGR